MSRERVSIAESEVRSARGGGAVSDAPEFPIEPWALRETSLNREALAVTESVFALSNGHIGMRGTLDEG